MDDLANKFRNEPTVVASLDGDMAVLLADGSCASFVDGVWQPGIVFDSQDFIQMAKIEDPKRIIELLSAAAESLANSAAQAGSEEET